MICRSPEDVTEQKAAEFTGRQQQDRFWRSPGAGSGVGTEVSRSLWQVGWLSSGFWRSAEASSGQEVSSGGQWKTEAGRVADLLVIKVVMSRRQVAAAGSGSRL